MAFFLIMNLPMSFSHEQYVFMTNLLKSNCNFLEYGSGNSTLLFSYFAKKYISIEHNHDWYQKINSEIKKYNLHFVDHIYVPAADNQPHSYMDLEEYNLSNGQLLFFDYIRHPKKLNLNFDYVFIDGRARVHCCNFIKKFLKKDSLVFFHDWGRDYYHSVLDKYNLVNQLDNLAVLSLK